MTYYLQKSIFNRPNYPPNGCTYIGDVSMIRVKFLGLEKFRILFENAMQFIEEHSCRFQNEEKKEFDLWEMLLSEGKHDLIEKLRRVERQEGGFGTIIIPEGGFSSNKQTHEMVVSWLEKMGTNVLDVKKEIAELEEALHGKKRKVSQREMEKAE